MQMLGLVSGGGQLAIRLAPSQGLRVFCARAMIWMMRRWRLTGTARTRFGALPSSGAQG